MVPSVKREGFSSWIMLSHSMINKVSACAPSLNLTDRHAEFSRLLMRCITTLRNKGMEQRHIRTSSVAAWASTTLGPNSPRSNARSTQDHTAVPRGVGLQKMLYSTIFRPFSYSNSSSSSRMLTRAEFSLRLLTASALVLGVLTGVATAVSKGAPPFRQSAGE